MSERVLLVKQYLLALSLVLLHVILEKDFLFVVSVDHIFIYKHIRSISIYLKEFYRKT